MSLNGKRVVIVGGTSGIGYSTAEAFLKEGAEVIIASRSASKVSVAKQSLGGKVEGYELDFRDEENLATVFQSIGHLDHLVVTAGEGAMGHFNDLAVADAKEAFDSKFWGQYVTVRAAVPYVNGQGSITMTSGVYGKRPPKGGTTLAAINSAVEGLARGLAIDLAPIRVNVVSPGIVDTPIYAGMSEEEREAMFNGIAQQLPVRHVAKAEEIAESYVYLAKSDFTSGAVVLVDGGAHLV